MNLREWEMVWICILIFSVEVEMNDQEKKEIQQEEMAIRQMLVGLNMKREVGQDFSNALKDWSQEYSHLQECA